MEKLENFSAIEIGKAVNEGQISPTQVINYFIERIKKRNPSINAFVYTKFEEAISEAKMLEKRLAKKEVVGPLASVPIALKDFLPSKIGWPNSHGGVKSLIKIDNYDSEFYKAAKNSGAIALGKTNAPAFGFRGTTDNKLYGPTSTPFNIKYNSGGSSGGSAAALSDGLIAMGEASDGGGSIRIPASWCGLVGFKPSVGVVPSLSRPDGFCGTHPYCTNGALTKTVADSALIYSLMAYYNPRDPHSRRQGKDYLKLMKQPIKNWKIGYSEDLGIFPVENEVATIVKKAAGRFSETGAVIDNIGFKIGYKLKKLTDMWCKTILIDSAIELELLKSEGDDFANLHKQELPKEFIYWLKKTKKSNLMDLYQFNLMRTAILDAFEDIFANYDLLITPTTACLPVKNKNNFDTKGPTQICGKDVDPLIGFALTFLTNFTGHPAISIPAGVAKNNLPVGMQIIGKKFHDEELFAAAYNFEQIQPWDYTIPFNRM